MQEVKLAKKPNWCHRNASEMRLASSDNDQVTILGKRAALSINGSTKGNWTVTWKITLSTAGEYFMGRICMSTANLRTAFGIDDICTDIGRPFVERYGADTAFPGSFIRQGGLLNIPNPGTGEDLDANISLVVTRDITIAIALLIGDSK